MKIITTVPRGCLAGWLDGGSARVFKAPQRIAPAPKAAFEHRGWQKVSRRCLALSLIGAQSLAMAGPTVQLGQWKTAPDGIVTVDGESYDLKEDLGLEDDNATGIELRWGQWQARWQSVEMTGEGTVTTDNGSLLGLIDLGSTESEVHSEVSFDELQLGWLPLQWGPLSVGAIVKSLDGTLAAQETNIDEAREVSQVFPMLAAELNLPLGELVQLQVGGGWIAADDDETYEINAALGLRLKGLRASLGYRLQSYDITEPNESLDATLRGLALRVGWAF